MLPFLENYAERGCVVIDRMFDPALIDAARGEYERQYEHFDPANLPLHMNVGEGRLHLPLRLRGALLEPGIYAHPLLMMVLKSLLRTPFVIDNFTCVTALPGAGEQKVHRDHPMIFDEQGPVAASMPAYAITVAIPLIDLDEDTGTTKLFPGSMGVMGAADGTPPQFDEEICPYVPRGGCFMMDYRLWHRGLPNRSDRDRPILYIVYAREWFTDIVNFKKHSRLVIDEEDAKAIPIEHRPMFRRLAAKGLHDMSIKELMGEA